MEKYIKQYPLAQGLVKIIFTIVEMNSSLQ